MTRHQFVIEKNVPLPKSNRGRGNTRYPFGRMDIGDSFFIAAPENATATQQRISSAATHFAARHACRFTTREVMEDGVIGVRIWRIE
jgi:hypothetical protein